VARRLSTEQIGHDVTENQARIAAEVSTEWSAILGCAPVHPGQDFFESGGSSLDAARLASRLSALYGVAVPLRAIFESPSVIGLVAWLRANQVSAQGRFMLLSADAAAAAQDPLVVFPDEEGDPAELRAFVGGIRRPVLGVRSRGLLGVGTPLLSIQEMTEDWVRAFAVWSQSRTVHLAGVGVGCVFAAAAANALVAEGWAIPGVVLVDPVTLKPTSFDAAVASRIRSLARSLGLVADTEPDSFESLRDALASSGSVISDAVFDEMVVRLRVAAANTVAACTAAPFDGLPRVLMLSRNGTSNFDASPPGAAHHALGAEGNLLESLEAFLAEVEGDPSSSSRPAGREPAATP